MDCKSTQKDVTRSSRSKTEETRKNYLSAFKKNFRSDGNQTSVFSVVASRPVTDSLTISERPVNYLSVAASVFELNSDNFLIFVINVKNRINN